ncbi:MAG: hypothetical protein U0176_00795 [Bacteroidia bacterium]
MDGCLIADHTVSKCDFAFYICPEKHFLFVELKGTDILKAIEQILVTIRHFRAKTTISKDSIRAFVISSAVPSGSNQKVRDAISLFKRDTGRDLIVKNSQCVYEIP